MKTISRLILQHKAFDWMREMIEQMFLMIFACYVLGLLVDTIWEDSIEAYLSLNTLFAVVLVIGVMATLSSVRTVKTRRNQIGNEVVIPVIFAGTVGATVMGYDTRDAGWFSVIVGLVCGVLIILVSLLILRGADRE